MSDDIMEEAAAAPRLDHPTHVDALTLNVERACQAAIDMAMHVVAERRLGIPQSNAHAFHLLERDGVIGDGAHIGARCELLRGARVWPGVHIPDGGIRYSTDV